MPLFPIPPPLPRLCTLHTGMHPAALLPERDHVRLPTISTLSTLARTPQLLSLNEILSEHAHALLTGMHPAVMPEQNPVRACPHSPHCHAPRSSP
eukprot:364649-Chlamydomonas_euryale.AAC.6